VDRAGAAHVLSRSGARDRARHRPRAFRDGDRSGTWRRIGFAQGFVVEARWSLGFLGLFVAQAMVALPSHMYAVPATAFVLVLLGVFVESVARALWARHEQARPG
jgi:hypothetical protein